MIVSVIGGYMSDLGNELKYVGEKSEFVYNQLEKFYYELEATSGISGMTPGAEIIWCWLLETMNAELTAAIPSQGFVKSLSTFDFDIYEEILKNSRTTRMQINTGPSVCWKDHHRYCWMIDRSDIIIFIWDGANNSIENAFAYAKHMKKESIIINPNNYRK